MTTFGDAENYVDIFLFYGDNYLFVFKYYALFIQTPDQMDLGV